MGRLEGRWQPRLSKKSACFLPLPAREKVKPIAEKKNGNDTNHPLPFTKNLEMYESRPRQRRREHNVDRRNAPEKRCSVTDLSQ